MAKLIGLFKRRDGLSAAEFRDYYENQHAPMATGHLGHLFASYTRSYVAHEISGEGNPVDQDVDVVTEIVFRDDAAMAEMFALAGNDPELRELIAADEARFMDRAASRLIIVTEHAATELHPTGT